LENFKSCITQQFFFHGGVIFKVYTMANFTCVLKRPSFEDDDLKGKHEKGELSIDDVPRVSKPKENFDSELRENDPSLQFFSEVSEKLVEKAFLTKDNFDENFENFVSNASHKTEELITLLEEKLAALKLKNAKFQK